MPPERIPGMARLLGWADDRDPRGVSSRDAGPMVTTGAPRGKDERLGRREHMSGCAGSCPDDIMREQRVVREASQLLRVSKGRYSAHRVTGRVANLVGGLSAHGRLLSSRVAFRPVDPNRRRAPRPVPRQR